MKIEVNNNTIIFNNSNKKTEIHPLWLRERVSNKEYLDQKTEQRLFDPSLLENIKIKNAIIKGNILELTFNDGVQSRFHLNKLKSEFLDSNNLINTVKINLWDSTLKKIPKYKFKTI